MNTNLQAARPLRDSSHLGRKSDCPDPIHADIFSKGKSAALGPSFYVFFHWLLIALLSVVMAMVGFHFLYHAKWAGVVEDTPWVIWYSAVSLVTWSLSWLYARKKSWADWIVYGFISPLIGCIIFFPFNPLAFLTEFGFCWIVFPVGIVTGALAAAISWPFQKRYALNKDRSGAS